MNLNNIDSFNFSGGSVRCIAFAGAIKYLCDNKKIDLTKIINFYGTSAGGIIAYGLALGYTPNEIIFVFYKFNFGLLAKINDNYMTDIIQNHGLNDGSSFRYFFSLLLKKKLGVYDINFEDFYKQTNINLCFFGYNITDYTTDLFSYKTTPQMSIILALSISTTIPIMYEPIKYNNKYYIDGGIMRGNNINCLDNSKKNILSFALRYRILPEYNSNTFLFNILLKLYAARSNMSNINSYNASTEIVVDVIIDNINPYTDITRLTPTKVNELVLSGQNAALQYILSNTI